MAKLDTVDNGKVIKLSRPVAFTYDCIERQGTCRLAGDGVRLTLRLKHFTSTPPDVLEGEAWFADYVTRPLIVEELALDAATRWGCAVTATGRTDTHGLITADEWP